MTEQGPVPREQGQHLAVETPFQGNACPARAQGQALAGRQLPVRDIMLQSQAPDLDISEVKRNSNRNSEKRGHSPGQLTFHQRGCAASKPACLDQGERDTTNRGAVQGSGQRELESTASPEFSAPATLLGRNELTFKPCTWVGQGCSRGKERGLTPQPPAASSRPPCALHRQRLGS